MGCIIFMYKKVYEDNLSSITQALKQGKIILLQIFIKNIKTG